MSKKVVLAAHQPNFIPYPGFFDKMSHADIMVIRDECQFTKGDYHHRNRIRVNGADNENNPQFNWISAPVAEDNRSYIKDIAIKEGAVRKNKNWKDDLLHQVSAAYSKAPHFSEFFPEFEGIIRASNGSLVGLNMNIINWLSSKFNIQPRVVRASSLGLKPDKYDPHAVHNPSEDIAVHCERLGANIYLSGAGARAYLDHTPFDKRGIEVVYQDYSHASYKQAFPGFVPNMSSIDSLFCIGRLPDKARPSVPEHLDLASKATAA